MFAEYFDFEFKIEFEVLSRVHFSEHGHDAHEPRIRLLKDLKKTKNLGFFFIQSNTKDYFALRTRFENLGNKRNNIEQFLFAHMKSFDS